MQRIILKLPPHPPGAVKACKTGVSRPRVQNMQEVSMAGIPRNARIEETKDQCSFVLLLTFGEVPGARQQVESKRKSDLPVQYVV